MNAITGSSDAGKSSLLRALFWSLFNKPSGSAYTSHWSRHVLVRAKISDHVITRKRTPSQNLYFLDGQKLKAFGQEPPLEVIKAANLDTINWQKQLDGPFLLSKSPGEVAQQLNEVANLEIIDRSLANCASQMRKMKGDKDILTERAVSLEKELTEWASLDEAEVSLNAIITRKTDIDALRDKRDKLTAILSEIEKVLERQKRLPSVEAVESDFEKLRRMQESLLPTERRLSALKSLLSAIATKRERRQDLEETLKFAERDLKKHMPNICPLCGQEVRK